MECRGMSATSKVRRLDYDSYQSYKEHSRTVSFLGEKKRNNKKNLKKEDEAEVNHEAKL